MLSVVVGVVFVAVTWFYFFLRNAYSFWKRRGVVFVPPTYVLGSLPKSTLVKEAMSDEMDVIYKKYKDGHKYVGIYFLHQPVLFVIDPGLVRNILAKDFNHFVDRGVFMNEEDDPLSGHLFALSGQKWKRLRQKLTPVFTSGRLKSMFGTLVACTNELQNCLDDSISKSEDIDIKLVLAKYTIDVIGSCAFGIECNSFRDPNLEFVRLGELAFKPTTSDRIRFMFCNMFQDLSKKLHIRASNKEVDRFFRKLIADTVEYREKNGVERNDFLQLLIRLKNEGNLDGEGDDVKLTIDQIAAQAFLFFLAGFETSSTTMAFTLYELAENQELQKRARDEIEEVVERFGGEVTYDGVKEMKLLDRIVKESLRKHSSFGAIQRVVTEPYDIPGTDIRLENGTTVFIPVQSLHSDPEYYPDPEKFDPDRFTEEAIASRPDYVYLPFGDGPRNCIGLRFGMMQVKVGLCRLLLNYNFEPSVKTKHPLKLDPSTFVRAILGGIWLNATKISK